MHTLRHTCAHLHTDTLLDMKTWIWNIYMHVLARMHCAHCLLLHTLARWHNYTHTNTHTPRSLFICACPAAANHLANFFTEWRFLCLLGHVMIIFYLIRLHLNAPSPFPPPALNTAPSIKHAFKIGYVRALENGNEWYRCSCHWVTYYILIREILHCNYMKYSNCDWKCTPE